MDAFSCHSLKKAHQKTTTQLIETCDQLDELKRSYHTLDDKLSEREGYFSKRECELQELHRCEIAKGEMILKIFVRFYETKWKTREVNFDFEPR